MPRKLEMRRFLAAVDIYGVDAREALIEAGFHHKQINAKARKAEGRGYYEYGVVQDRGWLTDKGREFLADR